MNWKSIKFVWGRILQVEAFLLLLPLVTSFIYRENWYIQCSFLITMILLLAIGSLLSREQELDSLYTEEGMLIVSGSWILMSFFGALPFLLTGTIPSFFDAFFEIVSGFTTTGATILNDIEALPHSLLLWRSFTHFIGGMGIIVFSFAVLPKSTKHSAYIMKAEVPGPEFGKIVPRIKDTAKILYYIYIGMTLLLILVYLTLGMNLFDSLIHAFGTAGTGGFSNYNASLEAFSPSIQMVTAVAMLLFGVNFNIYFFSLTKGIKEGIRSEELYWYLGIIGLFTLSMTVKNLEIYSLKDSFMNSFFTSSSFMTTTGFVNSNFNYWPVFSKGLLLILMFIGGSAGSTAGGLKVSRVMITVKEGVAEIKRIFNPHRVSSMNVDGKPVDDEMRAGITRYLLVYIGLFFIFLLIMTYRSEDFLESFSVVASCFNNIGPIIGSGKEMINFSLYTNLEKVILSLAMLAGRLELYPMLLFLMPKIWRTR